MKKTTILKRGLLESVGPTLTPPTLGPPLDSPQSVRFCFGGAFNLTYIFLAGSVLVFSSAERSVTHCIFF